jgi:anti-sigma factor RsiW
VNCADVEILLADYVDGTLHGEAASALETHLAGCAACAILARDSAEAVAFMERAAEVEAPPELVTRILFEVTAGSSRLGRTACSAAGWNRCSSPASPWGWR